MAAIAPLATGTFTAGPQDDIAAVDVYELVTTSGKQMITSIQELANKSAEFEFFTDALKSDELGDFLKKIDGKIALDTGGLTDRLLEASSSFKNAYRDLSDKVRSGAAGLLGGDKAKSLMCTINDVKSKVDSANIKDIKQLGGFINSFTGSNIFSGKDNSALGNLLGSVVGQASSLGLKDAFTAVTSTITDYPLLTKVVKATLPLALKSGDLRLLREMSNSPAAKLINIFSPGFTNTISKTFTFPSGNRRNSINSFDDFFTAVGNIDDQWDTLFRDGDDTGVNLLSLLGGSRDFQSLIVSGVGWYADSSTKKQKSYALASVYKQTSVYAEIRKHFPQTTLMSVGPVTAKAAETSKVYDPRVLNQVAGILFS